MAKSPDGDALPEVAPELGAVDVRISEEGVLGERASRRALEAALKEAPRMLDAQRWLEEAGKARRRVCVVLKDGQLRGTGFLVGEDRVLTCHHVAGKDAQGVEFIFDYAPGDEGQASTKKRWVAKECLAWRPAAEHEIRSAALPGESGPQADELDFALFRTNEKPGRERVKGRRRGWFTVPAQAMPFVPKEVATAPNIILQHPAGADGRLEPLQIALSTTPQAEVNGNGTRVTYLINTLAGSSGSPAFDLDWNLVAVHQGYSDEKKRNRGIPIAAIRQWLLEVRLLEAAHFVPWRERRLSPALAVGLGALVAAGGLLAWVGVCRGWLDPRQETMVRLDLRERLLAGWTGCGCPGPGRECEDSSGRVTAAPRRPYWIDRWEVAGGELRAWTASERGANCRPAPGAAPPWSGDGERPAVLVSWDCARRYCEQRGGRLPTRAERTFAASGCNCQRLFPWGAAAPGEKNVRLAWDVGALEPVPVQSRAPRDRTPDGVWHLGGNVREWVDDGVHADGICTTMGAGFTTLPKESDLASPTAFSLIECRGHPDVGFRCAGDDEAAP